ncbi:MAG: UvrB/UvrC motif-containing protein, partial [Muribaculaceae bacterium]|nr:UvrB/UvrC motif-containing protein [Muribaculaceae bacterium]
FLRSHRSLTQTVGRAARNLNGQVIMSADKITDSMRLTIDETERRRKLQMDYNEALGITPAAIIKARNAIIGREADEEDFRPSRQQNARDKARDKEKNRKPASMPYVEEFSNKADIAADPVVAYMNPAELQRNINMLRQNMLKAAKEMEFMEAARLRDEIIKLEQRLASIENAAD